MVVSVFILLVGWLVLLAHKVYSDFRTSATKILSILKNSVFSEEMNDFKEVTADNLARIRGANAMNQDAIAEILGVPATAISHIEHAKRPLKKAEKAVLDWHFFKIPPTNPES